MDTALMEGLAQALNPAKNADILARCTVYPWVVTVRARRFDAEYCGGAYRMTEQTTIVQAPLGEGPDPHDLVPDGWELMRGDVFPAMRFDDMNSSSRLLYEPQYRAYLAWRQQRAGLPVDSESIYERAYEWVRDAR